MYCENNKFIQAFSAYFGTRNNFLILSNSTALLDGWYRCGGNAKAFLKFININDKIILFRWINKNALLLFKNIEVPKLKEFDQGICCSVFGEDMERVWKMWNMANKNLEKFESIININDKLCLSFWQSE
jgi:hypothetical protein